ncbi:MAG TPA: cytochrome c oxidase assembly protein, partial [Rhodoglobus sp.]|nr:cytochrome c oxidase assembly protein [Rhodoglobus sp.]
MHQHATGPAATLEALLLALAASAMAVYVCGVVLARRRGRAWPLTRTVLWCAGIAVATASVTGPIAAAAHGSFVAHMTTHLLAGMIAPLLLVLAAPVTLALRTLAPAPARRVSRLLRSTPGRVVAHPLTALALSAGGLWIIYLTPVLAVMRESWLVHAAVHGHLLLAGYLFVAAVVGLDPRPHPTPRFVVAAILVVSIAAHGILAKHLYAHPPGGFAPADVQAGAQLMYYAGALVEAVVVVIFCAQWYRAADPRRHASAVGSPAAPP